MGSSLTIPILAGLFALGSAATFALTSAEAQIAGTAAVRTFTNTPDGLTDSLSANYLDFTFDYPADWNVARPAEPGFFVRVSKSGSESFAVGYWREPDLVTLGLRALLETDEITESALTDIVLGRVARTLAERYARLTNSRKVREASISSDHFDGYEVYLTAAPSEGNETGLWSRLIVQLPTGNEEFEETLKSLFEGGPILLLTARPTASGIRGPDDVGVRGYLPGVLASFKNRRAISALLRSELRNLVVHQEVYLMDNSRYMPAGVATDNSPHAEFRPGPGVRLVIAEGTADGWSAIATHVSAPAITCGIFVGTAPPPGNPAVTEGEPKCVGETR